nr:MAG TPA: hypothetical protein [Caudoviricetes sp.]
MIIDEAETTKRTYYFLKSYKSLVKLSNFEGKHGAFEARAIEIVNMIQSYRDSLDDVKREIFYNLFIVSQRKKQTLKQLYQSLAIDKVAYEHLKAEILLGFAKSYRGGVLLVYQNRFNH